MARHFRFERGKGVGAQASHCEGRLMSHRLNEGFNWPPAAIPAGKPVSSSPVAVSRAGLCAVRSTVLRDESLLPAALLPFCAGVPAIGVGQDASRATSFNGRAFSPCRFDADDFQSRAAAVGHEVQPLSDVRRTDARSAQIGRPDGVLRAFQVSPNKVEPSEAVFARNLLSKHNWRPALRQEVKERWPQMPLVIKPQPLACRAERLAGATARPNSTIVRPPSAS